jgi:general secretion pathway protein D
MNLQIPRGFVAALALAAAAVGGVAIAQTPATAGAAAPAPAPQPAEDTVTLNFVNADIHAVIKAVAEMTGRNFLIDPRVQGTVSIIAPRPVPRNMVFPILLSALRVQGFAAVGGDLGVIHVVPEAEAKFYGSARDPRRARGDQIVTEVFQLQHESAAQIVPVLRPLVAPNNVINAFPASNVLVVTDYASNLERIRKVIGTVDQPGASELTTVKLRFAAAVDVGQAVQRLVPEASQAAGPGAGPRVAVSVDPRTNSLLVRADNPTLAKRIRDLAAGMDVPSASGGNIHVVYLKNAEATRLAESLRAMISGQPVASRTSTPLGPATPGGLGATTGLGAPVQVAQAAPPPPPTPVGSSASPGAATAAGALTTASIQAHQETNSLVIIAPDAVYNSLRSVIDKLDARRAQVYVEALIVEIAATKAAEFGIQWQSLPNGNAGGTQGFGVQNFNLTPGSNIGQIAQNPLSIGQGLSLGLIRGRITFGGTEILNLAALVRALDKDSTANILSTPQLLTLDNEEARIQVGQNIPIVTGSFTLAGAGAGVVNPFQTVDRRDIGVALRIRPQIAEGGTVRMQIYQEVSSIFNAQSAQGIILNKRSIESNVVVDDGQIVVLGGLISDDVQTGKEAVPVLGDIPVLGTLFRYDTRRREKINLMVFLRPIVLRDDTMTATLTGNRYDYIRGTQNALQPPDRIPLPNMRDNQLPEALPPLLPGQPAVPPRETPPAAPQRESGQQAQ